MRSDGRTGESAPPEGRRRVLYGRRRGRRLRAGRRALLDEVLPRLDVAVPESGALDPFALFDPRPRAVWLELGFGAGEHLAWQALRHPEIGFIGCEPYLDGAAKLVAAIARDGLSNVRLFRDDARLLVGSLAEGSIDRVFVLFPDPWPKARHHKRRLLSRDGFAALARAMRDGAELRIATDDAGYLAWILEHALGEGSFAWHARGPADWRTRPGDWPPTRYEEKAVAAGRRPAYLSYARRPRTGADSS